ncbi:hypothetical protein EHQ91_09410 [Leptospira biflexa]|uniref:hypothetical protein n=1 Tax=Leptospira biflexa TaxID=172 RepID=UPI001090C6BB|nr:hypothetical protein [Leptospira biflexa]TGM55149.1 hypothetical protein EHQ91_09410 [Leptospira biflexa]
MRKPSISESSFGYYTSLMMNQINYESIQTMNRKKIVRWIISLLFLGGLSFFSVGCITPDMGNESYYSRNQEESGPYYRQNHIPYHGNSYRYGVPYHGRGTQFHHPRSGGGHNPMHIPGGRYQNLGRPGKWRL